MSASNYDQLYDDINTLQRQLTAKLSSSLSIEELEMLQDLLFIIVYRESVPMPKATAKVERILSKYQRRVSHV